ncbi:ATP synthase F(1) complex subunit epsilon, mitochondrial-like [Clavelina lepadiformis]|uniref:ATP synthase F(1) complex subunit epsilon, mitochondrial-like n=1 Tax=Clavelina lepadiformis TaxID=159417 RepID=UPI00404386E6
MLPFRQAGISYIRYSQICARAVRNALKAEHQEAAQTRSTKTVIFRKWEDGKAVGAFTKNE